MESPTVGPHPVGPQPGVSLGVPSDAETFVDMDPEPSATLDGNGNISLVTYGSSSCPPAVAKAEATSADTVTIDLDGQTEGPCTADFAPTTHTIPLPGGATGRPLTVQLNYINEPWE